MKKDEIVKAERPTRRKKPLTIWDRISKIFINAEEEGKKINRNKVYARQV